MKSKVVMAGLALIAAIFFSTDTKAADRRGDDYGRNRYERNDGYGHRRHYNSRVVVVNRPRVVVYGRPNYCRPVHYRPARYHGYAYGYRHHHRCY